MSIENFILKIKDFDNFSASAKIDFFVYFLTELENKEGIRNKDIEECFDKLNISKYSNIPQYLKVNSKKVKGKLSKFILNKGLYRLERQRKNQIEAILEIAPLIAPSNDYFPLELFKNTRGYLEAISLQAAACYDNYLFDACAVMTRKLLEVLIIESFERHSIESKIKDTNDNFFFLSDLIDKFRSEKKWNIGRNAKESIPKLKKMGDLSAHNRRYVSKKADIDKLKDDLRIVFEELIHIIDYPNWK
ncbi:hypothetical protein [uncultured Flavobacterium sp.]|uniref:hypothetical protein n=1 Tax=uncultured Flavobacterium sp. TaxID=165435 RepID=UPI0030817DD3